jgi:hypothetical protein
MEEGGPMTCTPNLTGQLPCPLNNVELGSPGNAQGLSDSTFEGALVSYLLANPGVSCCVGTRIFPLAVSRNNQSWPVLVYTVHKDHATGVSGSLGYATASVELDIWSTAYTDLQRTAEVLRRALQGFHSGWWGQVGILSVTMDEDADQSAEQPSDGSGTWYFSRQMGFNVIYSEPVPKF